MNGEVFFIGLLAFIVFLGAFAFFDEGEDWWGIGATALFVVLCCIATRVWQTPEEKFVDAAQEAARHTEEITPRKVSSADGCTVYTFKPQDRWLYFTKCDKSEVTTENEYTVQHGKKKITETLEIKTK